MCWLVVSVDTNNGLRRVYPCSPFIAATLIEVFCEGIGKLVVGCLDG